MLLPQNDGIALEHRHFFMKVYRWMSIGLVLSAAAAWWVYRTPEAARAIIHDELHFMGLLGIELLLVFVLAAAKDKLSLGATMFFFMTYCVTTGLTLSVVLFVYTATSVVTTFCVTAGMFGVMSAYGYFTDHDLASWGHVLLSGLLGLILASFANFWLRSAAIDWIVTLSGIVIFTGLIAYDTNKLRALDLTGTIDGSEQQEREAIDGALDLYLDFVNLFLKLLRVLGRKK